MKGADGGSLTYQCCRLIESAELLGNEQCYLFTVGVVGLDVVDLSGRLHA